ncbi:MULTISPECIES: hypothetical protein [unclassified Methylobacterium]|uniref:hypothetical protein n=1 Tax=unclassified Methylobacterium TaxID=2615210 RepID=UPI0025796844|nr:hypothetical protein [Methylobacterium sp.]
MAEPVTADLDTPEDDPGFDLDDAAILCCVLMFLGGLGGIASTLFLILVGG